MVEDVEAISDEEITDGEPAKGKKKGSDDISDEDAAADAFLASLQSSSQGINI